MRSGSHSEDSKNSNNVVLLNAKDETPAGGISKSSVSYKEYRKYRKIKGNEFKRSFPKKGKVVNSDEVPLDPARLSRHDTGASNIQPSAMRSVFHQKKIENKKKKLVKRIETTARAEVLNKEEEGFLEADDGQFTYTIKQRDLANAVDMASATKYFELHLTQFGPYHIDYTENGRHLLLGGKKGHVASFDWQTKKLHCETNVMEAVRDVKWMHTENIYAIAQKHYTYVYDNVGTELHCIKTLHDVRRMDFLSRHFLLVASVRYVKYSFPSQSGTGWLHYLDVSIGKMVASFPTRQGSLDIMCQNPANAIIHTGHTNGTVSLWSPNAQEPLVKMLAHSSSIKGLAVDHTGKYMVTTGLDRKCRVWDVRMYKQLHAYSLPFGLSHVSISQRMTVACAIGNNIQVFKDMHLGICHEPYLAHRCSGLISDMAFVPYEDVLGVGHAGGFTSMLVPGSGEANVDTLRSNPYESKNQRREREIKQLLDKLQPELISLDPNDITKVNEDMLERQMEERKKILYVRPINVEYTPKHKMRGRGTGAHKEHRKQVVKGDIRVERNKEKEEMERELFGRGEHKQSERSKHVLDRFRN